ncbi:MAG: hypothetical protein WB646_15655 [Steroidobacteraceae bacterium]
MLIWLDPPQRADHLLLGERDRCAYLAEYPVGAAYREHTLARLIWDFKCAPALARNDWRRQRRKQQAIEKMAAWLRAAVTRKQAECCTWVPIPPSKQRGDPDFDDRLWWTLSLAFRGYDLDLRRLVCQSESTGSDHSAVNRLSEQALYSMLQVDVRELQQQALRKRVVLFDDVLTSGKHFKCCQRRLLECVPQMQVFGLFLLRRLPQRCARSLGRAW